MLSRSAFTIVVIVGVLAQTTMFGCSKSEPKEPSSSEAPAAALGKDTSAEAQPAEPAGPQPVTKGPYTWAPGINVSSPMYVKCWVAIRNDQQDASFAKPYDKIKGPAEVSSLRGLDAAGGSFNHADWSGRVTSLSVGPKARATVYAEEGFRGASHTLEPGSQATLAETGLAQIGSMKIEFVE